MTMAAKNSKSLVVVESPAKARTISRILGSKYDVKASVGHVRDLPKRDLGIQIDDDFLPKYVVPKDKARTVKEIRDAAQKAGNVYLATDPDREGEAIAWHLLEAADLGDLPLQRVVFHEITPEAVQEAFEHPREIDMKLVDAQQARRVLDRLVGYRLHEAGILDNRRRAREAPGCAVVPRPPPGPRGQEAEARDPQRNRGPAARCTPPIG